MVRSRNLLAGLAGLAVLLMTSAAQAQIYRPGAPGEAGEWVTADRAVALGRSHHTEADVRFMQDMIIHHRQAVEMGALIEARSSHQGIALMGARIALSQSAEIARMQTWLTERGEAVAAPGGHHHHSGGAANAPSDQPVMAGMLSPAQMQELSEASGDRFDALYLTGMITHHRGAIMMVETLLAQPGTGEDVEMSGFLADINADQTSEIARMQQMLAVLG